MTRASMLLAPLALSALLALAPAAAQADCCTSFDAAEGPLVVAGDHALLGYATTQADEENSAPVGGLARIASDGTLADAPLPGAAAVTPTGPSISAPAFGAPLPGSDGALAWTQDDQVLAAPLAPTGLGASPPITVATSADKGSAQSVPLAGGALLVTWLRGPVLHGRTLGADGTLGADTVIASGVAVPGPVYALEGSTDGRAAVLFMDVQGLEGVALGSTLSAPPPPRTLVVPKPQLAKIGGRGLVAASSDGAGGLWAVVAEGATSHPSTVLVGLSGGGDTAPESTLAKPAKGFYSSAAVAPGAVAYRARGKAGAGDVFLRPLTADARTGATVHVTHTAGDEQAVDAVATVPSGGFTVLYDRVPHHQHHSDLLLQALPPSGAASAPELDVSATKKADEGAGQLAIAADGTTYVSYLSTFPENDGNGTTCTQLFERARAAAAPFAPAHMVADCSITSSA